MIQVINVTKAFGPKKLFEDVSTLFPRGRRYGLTGPNGSGKSTFMKILSGDEEPDTGMVSRPRKLGVLRQDQFQYDRDRVVDAVMMGNPILWKALQEKEQLLQSAHIDERIGVRLGELETTIAEEEGYTAESAAAELLDGLGISEVHHHKPMSELAGGLKLRVLLAQALFGKPDALLLDEPTNHLDLDSINWLQEFLLGYDGVLVVISHDRHFLNEICTHIADIDYETIISYPGGYDDMVVHKAGVRSRIESENSDKTKKIAQLQEFVARFSAGTRASQVQSRKKQIEKLQLSDLKRSNIARPFIRFEQKRPSGKQVLQVEKLSKAYGPLPVIEDAQFTITRGDKIAVVGRNGVGKTTLVKLLAGELEPDAGNVTWGYETSVGLLHQDMRQGIPSGTTVADWLHEIDPKATNEEIRGILGRMLFQGEEGLKPTDALSGGEAVRLLLAKMMVAKNNVLIMDEPTNHLDLESIVALTDAVERFEGTILYVTHDRDLIEAATRVLWFGPNGLIDFNGTYLELLEKKVSEPRARGEVRAEMSVPRLASISIDLDGLAHYARLHGLAAHDLPESALSAVARLAPGRLAELLDARGAKGTFFAIGDEIGEAGSGPLRQVAEAGHEIGNHTRSHPYALTRLSPEVQRAEVEGGAEAIAAAVGVRPSGFRAPGYTLSASVLEAVAATGHVYDSSTFPAAPYYFAKAAILGLMRLRGRPSAAILDRSRVLSAPRLPYHPSRDEPYAQGDLTLLELPITVDPVARIPFIGTSVCALPLGVVRTLYKSVRRLPFVNLELHGIDLLDGSDGGGPRLQAARRDLRISARAKTERLREVLRWLSDDYQLLPLRAVAETWSAAAPP